MRGAVSTGAPLGDEHAASNSRMSPNAVLAFVNAASEVSDRADIHRANGAHARIRTGDLLLTKEMLYRLSYVGGAVQPILSAAY